VTYLKQQLARLTPATAVSILTALVTLVAAFGVPVTKAQQASILVFGGSASLILFAHGLSKALSYLTPQTITGLVTAAIGVAISFGAPITKAQADSVLQLTWLLAGILLVHGVVHTVARDRRNPEVAGAPLSEECKGPGAAVPVSVVVGEHPYYKTGLHKPKNAPALLAARILSTAAFVIPSSDDNFAGATFGLYGNDKFGVCGPTSLANFVRLVSKRLTGVQVTPSQQDVFALYRLSGNPNFNPNLPEGDPRQEDGGVDMQTMLEATMVHGIGDGTGGTLKPVAFAKLNINSDEELRAANAIFGGVLWGARLDTAQQAQTNATPPKWTYKASPVWGGHAILNGKYEPEGAGVDAEVISWEKDVETTDSFREHQLEQAWVVIFPWHLEHPAFLAGVNLAVLAAEYKALTGKELPIPAPAPTPGPTSTASAADRELWEGVAAWARGRHSATTKTIAAKLVAWAKEVGLT